MRLKQDFWAVFILISIRFWASGAFSRVSPEFCSLNATNASCWILDYQRGPLRSYGAFDWHLAAIPVAPCNKIPEYRVFFVTKWVHLIDMLLADGYRCQWMETSLKGSKYVKLPNKDRLINLFQSRCVYYRSDTCTNTLVTVT